MNELAHTYGVDLWYVHPPETSLEQLNKVLQLYSSNIEVVPLGEDGQNFLLHHRDYPVSIQEGTVFAQTLILRAESAVDPQTLVPVFQQSWEWKNAREVVSQCQYVLRVTDFLASHIPYKERLFLFQRTLLAILEAIPCDAIHWTASQQFIDPLVYLKQSKSTSIINLSAIVNIRLFTIMGTESTNVMDSMGLSVLGLPDVQCHFTGLDLNEVGHVLQGAAYYLYEQGDVINDGETIAGIQPTDKWYCRHETSLATPKREVLDLNPGKPYNTGDR